MKLMLISPPETLPGEHELLNRLFAEGLEYFHLRKPGFSVGQMEQYILNIPEQYRKFVTIHSCHTLCRQYGLRGIHYSFYNASDKRGHSGVKKNSAYIQSASFHSLDDFENCTDEYDYVFLSPVFDSISKKGYSGRFSAETLSPVLRHFKEKSGVPWVIALGGVDEDKIELAKQYGFDGIALLGAIWEEHHFPLGEKEKNSVVEKFRRIRHRVNQDVSKLSVCINDRPYVLSIAGFDPSAGAGSLADIKTMKANKVYGLGVCTAITFQNDLYFDDVQWVDLETIKHQARLLFSRFVIHVVKIGLVQNMQVMEQLVQWLRHENPSIKIIWDPVIKATAGFEFHKNIDFAQLERICRYIHLITPNRDEIRMLVPGMEEEAAAAQLSTCCSVLLKGGHNEKEKKATDILYYKGEKYFYVIDRIENARKHGSGCVLSSAIASYIAKGLDTLDACAEAKKYITHFLKSTDELLGIHSN